MISSLRSQLWKWAYFVSLPLAAVIFFMPNSRWGAMDEGEFLYKDGAGIMTFWEHLALLFIPQKQKIFLFGTFRPLPYRLYFKILTSLGVSAHGYNYFDWVGSWIACLAFAWGLVILARRAFAVSKAAAWPVALLVWWTPTWILCTNMIYPDCWMQPGLLGIFWGLIYGLPDDLPIVFQKPSLRYPIAFLCAFLAFQSHEATFFMMFWTSFWIFCVSDPKKRDWAEILAPATLAIVYVLLYRGLDPSTSNRPEIQISYVPVDMAHTARYYLLIGLNAVSKPFLFLLSLNNGALGQSEASFPWAFLLTVLALGYALHPFAKPNDIKPQSRVGLYSWAFLLCGVACTIPYLVMKNRSLVYYGLRLQIMIAAWIAIRAFWNQENEKQRNASMAIVLFLAGSVVASFTLMDHWNWAKHYGGISLDIYARVMQMPGISECTPEHPCCLEFTQPQWVYNETTVNWNDGAPWPPRFVRPGASCSKTFRYEGPYTWER